MFGGNAPSLSDIAAVTGNNGNNGDGFGNGNGWWILIILFALFGWGRGGWGNGSGNCASEGGGTTIVTVPSCPPSYGYGGGWGMFDAASMQRGFDNSAVITKLDGINNGICSLGYDQLAQMNGINTNVMQTGFGITNAIQQDTVANMQNTNALSRQLADCCCENRAAIAQVRYDMATNTCALQNTIQNTTRDIMDNDNANWRALNDRLTAIQMDSLKEQLAEQKSLVQSLNLAASQANQNRYLVDQLRPCPTPAYITCNPWGGQAPYGSCCQQNNGCCN